MKGQGTFSCLFNELKVSNVDGPSSGRISMNKQSMASGGEETPMTLGGRPSQQELSSFEGNLQRPTAHKPPKNSFSIQKKSFFSSNKEESSSK